MKIVQEENLNQVGHHLRSSYDIDMMSCLFFALGMLLLQTPVFSRVPFSSTGHNDAVLRAERALKRTVL